MFHFRLIPASPVLTLNYKCSSGVWPHKERTRTVSEMLLPASDSQLNRREANHAQQAKQYLVRMQNTQVMLRSEKAAHTAAPWGLFLGGKKSVRALYLQLFCEFLRVPEYQTVLIVFHQFV